MYGMDCNKCDKNCIDCISLDKTHSKIIHLMQEIKKIKGIKNFYVLSGVRFDLATEEYLKELKGHISGKLKIAPEHVKI